MDEVKIDDDSKKSAKDTSIVDKDCEQSATCCDKIKYLIYDVNWFLVVYHISLIFAAIYATFDFARLLITDIRSPLALTRIYTWTFGKLY